MMQLNERIVDMGRVVGDVRNNRTLIRHNA